MMPLVFLQVLEPFCPLSEQENPEPEELEVSQPTCSATVFINSQTEFNSNLLLSDTPSLTHKDLPCAAPLTESEPLSFPLTVNASPSFSDAEAVPPPPLSDCTSASEQCLVSVPPLSNNPLDHHSGALSVEDDSCIPSQTQTDPPNPPVCVDVIPAPLSEILSDESQVENFPIRIVTSHSSSQKDETCMLQVPNSSCDSPTQAV